MTRLWLVRHAPTGLRAMIGRSDVPADLADRTALARRAAELPDGAVVVGSGLRRAEATADALAGARRRLPPDPRLAEMDFGRWEMRDFDTIAAAEPAYLRAFHERPGPVRAPGGESWDDLAARVSDAVDSLARRFAGGDVVVVSHFGAILTQVQRAWGVAAYTALAQPIAPLSLTRLAADGPDWRTEVVNLPP